MEKKSIPLIVLAVLLLAQLCFAQTNSISKDAVTAGNTMRYFAVGNVDTSSANEIVIGEGEGFAWYDGNFPQYRRTLYVYRPGTGIVWYDTMYAGEGGIEAVCIGDVNNDGTNEIVALNGSAYDGGQAHLSIYAYSGGDIWTKVWATTYTSQRFGERDLAIGDCDNDGQNELVVGFDWYGRCFRIYEHTGSNNFTESFNSGNISDVRSVQVADCDNDGNNEILVGTANWGTWDVRVYKWNGSAYALQWDSPTIGTMHAVCGDVDNDGLNEIVAASHDGDRHPDSVG
ncbi:MAG: VCBS repeat-containing protein, partial [Candidatus Edwardsbacteria bacterium]|nr:VCBS repeat-containing protein [Candidatus Edwardsbacteria bacterium]